MRSPSRAIELLALALTLAVGTSCGGDTSPGPSAAGLAIVTEPSDGVSGFPLASQPVIRIEDADGNLVTGGPRVTVRVTLGAGSGSVTLRGDKSVASVDGIVTFDDLQLDGSGTYTLQFAAPSLDSVESSSIHVVQVVDSLTLLTAPAGAVREYPFTTHPVVKLLDHAGLLVATATDSVTAVLASVGGKLIGTPRIAAVAGLATFTDLGVDSTADAQVAFLITGVDTVTSAHLTVAPPPAVALKITTAPAGAVSGLMLTTQPVIHLNDKDSLLVTSGSPIQVTASLANGSGTLQGTKAVMSIAGVVTFTNLRIDGVGAHTLQFAANPLVGAQAQPLVVVQVPASLALTVAPAGAAMGAPFTTQPVVQVRDNAGLLIATSTDTVTASIGGAGVLVGTTKAAAVGGIATFTDLGIDSTGDAQLAFAAPALSPVVLDHVIVGPVPVGSVQIVLANDSLLVGHVLHPDVVLQDIHGFFVDRPVTWTISDANLATINSVSGRLVAKHAGSLFLHATSEGKADSALVVVPNIAGATFTSVRAGEYHTCGLKAGGAAYCWGYNNAGQLGDGSVTNQLTPVLVQGGVSFSSVVPAYDFTCGIDLLGAAYCWGSNGNGHLGDSLSANSPVPAAVAGGHAFTQLVAGRGHACGLTVDSLAYCWGQNDLGQLGDSTTTVRRYPVAVVGGHKFASLHAFGGVATCGSVADGSAYCWGGAPHGDFLGGTLSFTARVYPQGNASGSQFSAFTSGGLFNCGLGASGTAYCWGYNDRGQLGDGTEIDHPDPAVVAGGHLYSSIVAGGEHVCAVGTDALTYCWGMNASAEMGDGKEVNRLLPNVVGGGLPFVSLTLGANHSCGQTASGATYCWGDDGSGQIGDGTGGGGGKNLVYFPTPVMEP